MTKTIQITHEDLRIAREATERLNGCLRTALNHYCIVAQALKREFKFEITYMGYYTARLSNGWELSWHCCSVVNEIIRPFDSGHDKIVATKLPFTLEVTITTPNVPA